MKQIIMLAAALAVGCWGQSYSFPPGNSSGGSGTVSSIATGCGTSGGTITTTGTIVATEPVNAQTGTTYTYLNGDCGKIVTHSNASAIAGTLPQANGSTFIAGWFMDVQNTGAGTLTITPTTSTIDGAATLTLATNQGARIVSDGTNYFTQRGKGNSGTVTSIGTTSPITGGTITTTGTIACATCTTSAASLTANQLIIGAGSQAEAALGSLGTTTTLLHGNAGGAPTFGAVSLTADVSGILPSANGGTANAFFTVSGPTTSAKTFTYPDASATVLTSNAAVTVAQGGTGLASGTSGGLLCYTGSTTLASSAALSSTVVMTGGGAGACPSTADTNLTVTGGRLIYNDGTGSIRIGGGVIDLGISSSVQQWGINSRTSGVLVLSGNGGLASNLFYANGASGGCIAFGKALTSCTSGITFDIKDSTASTGVTRARVLEGAGQSTSEVFGVYANDASTKRIDLTNNIFTVTSTLNIAGASYTWNGKTCTLVGTTPSCA